MNKTCVFQKPTASNDNLNIIHKFSLDKILENKRTTIYCNEEMRVSIDKNVIRILIFDSDNTNLIEKLRGYFYGNEY